MSRGHKARKALKALKAQQARTALTALTVHEAQQARRDQPEIPVHEAHRGRRVTKARKARQARRATRAIRATKVIQAHRGQQAVVVRAGERVVNIADGTSYNTFWRTSFDLTGLSDGDIVELMASYKESSGGLSVYWQFDNSGTGRGPFEDANGALTSVLGGKPNASYDDSNAGSLPDFTGSTRWKTGKALYTHTGTTTTRTIHVVGRTTASPRGTYGLRVYKQNLVEA